MRKFIILIILALGSLGVAYKLGYLDKMIVRYVLKEQLSKSKISTAAANEVITIHNASIQMILSESSDNKDATAILTLKLKNNSNKTHEVVRMQTEISHDVTFFEAFHKDGTRTIQEVYGIPIESFSIITLVPESHFAKISNIENLPKKGDSVSVKLIFSDNSEKSILATVK